MSVYLTRQDLMNDRARWKRKNKIAQLKRTISRLTEELQEAKQRADDISCSTQELITAIARHMGKLHVSGSLTPHLRITSNYAVTLTSTTANTY